MVLLGVYVTKSWSWLVREIQFLAGCRPPHNCQGKCPLSFGIFFVGAQSLYLELRTKNPRQEFARVRLHGLFASLRSNSSLVAMALKRTNFKDSGNIYMLVQPKTPSRWNFFKTEIEMLPAFFLFVYLGEFIRFWLSSDSHKEQLLSTHPNTQKNQGNDSMNVWNCFIQLISLNYCQIKTFTLEAAMRAKVSQLQRLHQRNMIRHNVQNKKGNDSRNNW